VQRRATAWLRRHGYLDERPPEERSDELPTQTALDACAEIAMGRGKVATLPNAEASEDDHESAPGKHAVAVDRGGCNLHAGVRIETGDDVGRERLLRYCARPPLSLERLRRLPGGRVAYRLKYVTRGRGKFRIMTGLQFMARLAALIAPPRYPLLRYAGALGPRSSWRKDIVPKPREARPACKEAPSERPGAMTPRAGPKKNGSPQRPERPRPRASSAASAIPQPPNVPAVVARVGDVIALAPNVLSVRHWDRLLGGLLYAATPRVEWAALLRRSFAADVMACVKCGGRLRVLAVITERESVRRILAHLGQETEILPLPRARDPTDDEQDDVDSMGQLGLQLA